MLKILVALFISVLAVNASAGLDTIIVDARTKSSVAIPKDQLYWSLVNSKIILKGFQNSESAAVIIDNKVANNSGYKTVESMAEMLRTVSKQSDNYLLKCYLVQGSTEIEYCNIRDYFNR